jgi:hypothetical protein
MMSNETIVTNVPIAWRHGPCVQSLNGTIACALIFQSRKVNTTFLQMQH